MKYLTVSIVVFLSQELYIFSPVQRVSLSLKLLKFIVGSHMLALNISWDRHTEDDAIEFTSNFNLRTGKSRLIFQLICKVVIGQLAVIGHL